ncbi:MAG: hypothetical protein KDE50_06830 [Caldilineaceae bacterium]|nr:hypothetical protein [Caldilineaceae bacterium]MCB0139609.1 hypothetical protein [Caldilineaceae bacterium]
MIAIFLRAEVNSLRFGEQLGKVMAELGLSVEALFASPYDPAANIARKNVLVAYRGWGKYESVFGGMPDDIDWYWTELSEQDIRERVFTIKWGFEEEFHTRSADGISSANQRGQEDSIVQLRNAVAEGRVLEPPILLAESGLRRVVILEGHSRILSYLAQPALVTFPIAAMIGVSDRMSEWSEW